jgi:iron complex outermembrane recepter protein
MSHYRRALAATLLASSASSVAYAQEAPAGDGDIVVVAQKREQALQDVPVSIAVITGEQIENAQITSIQDIGTRVPALSVAQFGGRAEVGYIFIRGLGNNSATHTLRAAAIIDDVPITDFRGINSNFLDVEQVEILRGPQSTLYGLTAEAGLVVVRSRRPGNAFGGRVSGEVNSFGDWSLTGSVDLPMAEGIRLGVSGFYENSNGFIRSQLISGRYNQGSSFAGRVRAIIEPFNGVELDLNYTRDEADDQYGQTFVPVDRQAYITRFSNPIAQATSSVPYASLQPLGRFENASDFRGFGRLSSDNISLRTSIDAGFANLVAVTAYREFSLSTAFDAGSQPGGISPFPGSPSSFIQSGEIDGNIKSFYQEVRLVSAGSDFPRWVVGGSYFSRDAANGIAFVRTTSIIPSPPFPPIPTNTLIPLGDAGSETFRSIAVFGQIELELGNQFELLGGLRWERTRSIGTNDGGFDGGAGFGPPTAFEILDDQYSAREESDVLLPKVTFSFVPNDRLRVYATIARGWLPGSADGDRAEGDDGIIDPERSWTYELGVKASLFGGRGYVSASIFRVDVTDYQEALNAGPITQFLENVPGARFQGFEIEAALPITDRFTLTGGFAYNDSTYRNFVEDFGAPFGTVDRSGNRIAGVPNYNFNVAGRYQWTDALFTEAEVVGSGSFLERQDRTGGRGTTLASTVFQPALGTFDGNVVVNLRGGYRGNGWSVLGYANNLFNKRYFSLVSNTFALAGPGDVHLLGAVGKPFEAGVRLSGQF